MTVLLAKPKFVTMLGEVGAWLYTISSNPTLAVDGKRWSAGPRTQISHAIVQRLIDGGFVKIAGEKMLDRELLELTEVGRDELMLYCIAKSVEISQAESVPQFAANGEQMPGACEVALDLAERMVDLRRHQTRAPEPWCTVHIVDGAAPPVELTIYLANIDRPGPRYAVMLSVLRAITEQAVAVIPFSEVDEFAAWCGMMAHALFNRAAVAAMDGDPAEDGGEE